MQELFHRTSKGGVVRKERYYAHGDSLSPLNFSTGTYYCARCDLETDAGHFVICELNGLQRKAGDSNVRRLAWWMRYKAPQFADDYTIDHAGNLFIAQVEGMRQALGPHRYGKWLRERWRPTKATQNMIDLYLRALFGPGWHSAH
jgi:hypothetical protein